MTKRLTLVLPLLAVLLTASPARADLANQMQASGVQGGLVVHLGCGDGRQTAKLARNDGFCVHGLDADPANVQRAQSHLRSLDVYGKASISVFDGDRLPYVDNLVNLVIADDLQDVSIDEVMRVLTPRGVAVVGGVKTVKPWPDEIDDWNHHLHGPDNNPAARDRRVSTPRHIQWVCGPLWARSHEFLSSTSGMISDEGRLFYVFDEGLTGTTDAPVPERWMMIARDAFNGKLLWKRPIPQWGTRGWKRTALRATSRMAPRRMVAGDGRLFATLGFTAPVSMLDAATGNTLHTFEHTENAQELRYLDGVLVVRRGEGTLAAVDVANAKTLWQTSGNVRPETTAAADGKVFFQEGGHLVCRSLKDGRPVWQLAEKAPLKQLLVFDEYVIVAGATTRALAADSGKPIWETNNAAARNPLFVAGGQLWVNATTGLDLATGKVKTTIQDTAAVFSEGHHPRCYPPKATDRFIITPFRGAEFISIDGGQHAQNDWLRGPCTFGVLPCNGLLYVAPNPCFCYTGVKLTGFNALAGARTEPSPPIPDAERVDRGPAFGQVAKPKSGDADPANWPAYRHDGRRSGGATTQVAADLAPRWSVDVGGRLTQPVIVSGGAADSGQGVVYVASKDTHTLHALDRSDGRQLWTFTAEGRIDSPPTVFGDIVLFGSAHGHVYCLRATDGALVWRFRAAENDQLMMAHEQLESPWRVHGSVLVEQGVAYFTAGRSTNLDGGIRVYGLDPISGAVLHKTTLDTWSPTRKDAENKPFVSAYHMEGAFSDILTSEGGFIYLGQYKLDPTLQQQEAPYILPDPARKTALGRTELLDAPFVEGMASMEKDENVQRDWQLRNHQALMDQLTKKYGGANLGDRTMGRRIFATGGFLDESWFNRTFWMYSETWPGFYIAHRAANTGQILCVDEEKTYAVQAYPSRNLQSPLFTPAKRGYLLLADDNDNEPVLPEYTRNVPKGIGFTRSRPPVWFKWIPVRVRAIVAAENALFIAGPPDVLVSDDPMASFDGRAGAVLWAVSKTDGKKLAELKLDAPPVFDGMAAAAGRLYLSTLDGRVTCMGP